MIIIIIVIIAILIIDIIIIIIHCHYYYHGCSDCVSAVFHYFIPIIKLLSKMFLTVKKMPKLFRFIVAIIIVARGARRILHHVVPRNVQLPLLSHRST